MSLSLLDFAQLVQTTLRSLQMYTANHPRTREATQILLDKLNEHFEQSQTIKIAASGGRLFMDGQPGDARSMHTTNLCKTLSDRSISGVLFEAGLDLDELISILEVLLLKPQRMEELGGAEAVIASKNMRHVRLTQTKFLEMGEDEEMAAAAAGADQPEEITDEEGERLKLFNIWLTKFKECVEAAAKEAEGTNWRPQFEGEFPPANLKPAGRLAIELRWETDSPPAIHWEAVQLALENLSPAEQLSVVTGRDTLPDIPPSLNKVMDGFIPDILAKAVIRLDSEGAEWSGLKDAVYSAITVKGDVSELYKAFGTHWLKSGKEAARVSDVKDRIQWDYLPLKDQLAYIEKPGGLWRILESQRNRLIAQVLEKQPLEVFHSLLEKIIYAVANGDAPLRENAARALEFITSSFGTISISKEAQKRLVKSLVLNFSREQDARVIASTFRSLLYAVTAFINGNEFPLAAEILTALDRCCASEPPEASQARLLTEIKSHLCVRANIEPVIRNYFELGADYLNGIAIPWLKALGHGSVEFLMEMLSEESDRRRRGQIMDTIRSFGNDILPDLVKSLDSDRWYVVRNTLILIAEMADQSCYASVVKCLQHSDSRVKKAAARTLWRGFGKQAVGPFLRIFNEAEPEIFEEILFGLAQIPAPEAIPVALDYAVEANHPDRFRAMALNVLVTNPSRESLPILIEFVKRKGRVITKAEPIEVRLAAAKAMAACGQEGRDKLAEIVDSEPNGADRDELSRILES